MGRDGYLLHTDPPSGPQGPASSAHVSCLLPGSLEGRDSSAPAQAPARSSALDRSEPGFLADPEPGSQELPDGALETWGWDVGCASLALRDEGDGIFPDFLAY